MLLLTDASSLSAVKVGTSLEGPGSSGRPQRPGQPEALCAAGGLSLDTEQVRRWMASRNGCAVRAQHLSRAVFANLDCLPQSEQARWCVWKSAELLYLLSAPEGNALNVLPVPALDREVVRF
ncbi:MAG: hypothetical protein ACLTYN_09850 [Dysosmobacter welbionis]